MDSNMPPENESPRPTPPPIISTPSAPLPIAPQPKKKGSGWKVFAIIASIFLVLSLLANLTQFAGGVASVAGRPIHTAGPKLEEVVMKFNYGAEKIAVIDVDGIITGQAVDPNGNTMVDIIRAQLKKADRDDDVRAVVLKVNSPGGEVLASDDIANAISEFQNDGGKPVVVSMGSLAASGGYYVSAPCRWIVANELTITGSIGVIMQGFNYRGLMDKVGLRPMVFKSGKFKDMLSGSKKEEEITPEETAMVQSLIDETFGKFKSVVEEGRNQSNLSNKDAGRKLSSDWEDYADGRILSGKEAHKLGFVDELGNFETAVERAEKIAGIGNATLVQYRQVFDISNFFKLFGETESRAVKLDIGVDFPKLQAGNLYFLSPTYIH